MGHLSTTTLHNLQKLQDRAINLIESAPIKDRIPSATLSVNELIKLDQETMVHIILNEQCPEILKQKFTKRSQVSKYETRRANDLQVPRPRLEITKRAFRTKVPRCGMISQTTLEMWNRLHFSNTRLETIFWGNETLET